MKHYQNLLKLLAALLLASPLLSPEFVFAAYNDVSMAAGTGNGVLSINGITVNVLGATIQQIVAGPTSFDVGMAANSSATFVSPSRNQLVLTVNGNTVAASECDGVTSSVSLNGPSSGTATTTITPSATICGTGQGGGGGGSGGGGGGGGGGGYTAPVATPAPAPVATTTSATTTPATASSTVSIASSTSLGQAVTPTPSIAQTTTSSGSVPKPVLAASQIAAIISLLQSFGADQSVITNVQASLNGLPTSGQSSTPSATMVASVPFTKNLKVGSRSPDVQNLQAYLNTHGFVIAVSGPGSPGNETTRFGQATKKALKKFQQSVGIVPASGMFGASTRAYINSHQ